MQLVSFILFHLSVTVWYL